MFRDILEARFRALLLTVVLAALAPFAIGQITTTALRGVVRDPSGAVIPNVKLVLKDKATGIERTAQSLSDGSFFFMNLVEGTYQLTASVEGFQTAAYSSVVVNAGRTTDLPVGMKLGTTSTVVEVSAVAVQLETTSNTISTTIVNNSIQNLPQAGRDSLNFALLMPGAMSAGTNRLSTFNGLPNASMNISIDGMNNNSQRFKSGGTSFFQFAPARLDAMEEVTISTSGLGAESSGEGAMQIQFVTKRGTNKYKFRILEQFHNEWLNAYPYMTKLRKAYNPNLFKTKTRENYSLGSVGGPLVPWVPYLKEKLFFFAYFEARPAPGSSTISTTVLQPEALAGNYTFIVAQNTADGYKVGDKRTVNVLDVARAAGFRSALDPTTKGILEQIRATESTEGASFQPIQAYPFRRTMLWPYSYQANYRYPTARVDYQITPKLAWHGSWAFRNQYNYGTPPYPGKAFSEYDWAGNTKTNTYIATSNLDWTVTPQMVNNVSFGIQTSAEHFSTKFDIRQWSKWGDRRIGLPQVAGVPLVTTTLPNSPSDVRNNPVYQLKDNLSLVKGKHTIKLGASLLHTFMWSRYYGNYAGVLNYSLGLRSDDPVYNVLRNAIVGAGASTTNNTDRDNFLNLYALLVGSVTGIGGTANVDPKTLKYEKFAPQPTNFAFTTVGLFAQDSFRLTPRLTLNYGLRWQLDGSIHATAKIYSGPDSVWGPSLGNFQPGVLGGNMNPAFVSMNNPYKADLINPAPNFGFNWNPKVDDGILGALLGGDKTVIGGSFGITYYNEGINTVSNYLPGGPGGTQALSSTANVDFTPGTLFLDSPTPNISVNPATYSFPIQLSNFMLNGGRSINAFNSNLKSPYTSNWTFRIQRELARGTRLDVRYVGNKSTHMWHQQNLNEINILENGFLPEFINARNNLALNQAAGVQSFANRSLPGQVALPIFEAAFGANGSQPALSTSSGFGNSSYIQTISYGSAGSMAGTLASTTAPTFFCRLVGANFPACAALGYTAARPYPINFFKANPFVNNINYLDSNGDNNYNGLQVELRRDLSRGFSVTGNYTWSHSLGTQGNVDGQGAEDSWITLRNARLSYGDSAFDHRHSIATYWSYDLPMGKARWFSPSNRFLARLLSDWNISGIYRIVSGAPGYFSGGRSTFNNLGADGGAVFGSGLTPEGLLTRVNTVVGGYDDACQCFHTDVADLQMANGAVDPKYFRPGDTPGLIGYLIPYRGKWSYSLDMSVSKEIPITERVKMGIKANIIDFLNHPFQGRGSTTITNTTFGQLSSFSGARTINLRAYVDF